MSRCQPTIKMILRIKKISISPNTIMNNLSSPANRFQEASKMHHNLHLSLQNPAWLLPRSSVDPTPQLPPRSPPLTGLCVVCLIWQKPHKQKEEFYWIWISFCPRAWVPLGGVADTALAPQQGRRPACTPAPRATTRPPPPPATQTRHRTRVALCIQTPTRDSHGGKLQT